MLLPNISTKFRFLHDFNLCCHKMISHVRLTALCNRRNEIKELYIFFCLAKFIFCQFGALLSKIEIIGQQVCKTVHIKWENHFGTTNKIFFDVKIFNLIYSVLRWIINWFLEWLKYEISYNMVIFGLFYGFHRFLNIIFRDDYTLNH